MRRTSILAILFSAGFGLSGLALAQGPGMAGGVAFKFGPDLAASDWRYMSFPTVRASSLLRAATIP